MRWYYGRRGVAEMRDDAVKDRIGEVNFLVRVTAKILAYLSDRDMHLQ